MRPLAAIRGLPQRAGDPLNRIRNRKTRTPLRPKPLSTWVLLWVFLAVAAGGWLYYNAQMSQVDAVRSDGSVQVELEITRLRVETIRNMLAVAAGIGGASALLLGFRRQQHEEYNSTQQRITELRIQAVAQLGSDSSTVRIGGLHNLDRLGEQHEDLRQIVLDEICSYLRLPYTPLNAGKGTGAESIRTSASDAVAPTAAVQNPEREVRFIAQEILQRRLRRGKDQRPVWEHERINLRSAFLDYIDFSGCHLHNAAFTNATFSGDADFEDTTFSGKTGFKGTTFGNMVNFQNATFSGNSSFGSANFNKHADFRGTTFSAYAGFGAATFNEDAHFTSASFNEIAYFKEATFNRSARFLDVTFTEGPYFAGASFNENGNFRSAIFNGDVDFGVAIFNGDASFNRSAFNAHAKFGSATFAKNADFKEAAFNGEADFESAAFNAYADFKGATFRADLSFVGVTFDGRASFDGVTFDGVAGFWDATFNRPLATNALPDGWRSVKDPDREGKWRLEPPPWPPTRRPHPQAV